MNERIFRLLTLEEVIVVYGNHMKRDFPKDELKPLHMLLTLVREGNYEPYGLFEDGQLIAYAFYWRTQGAGYVMLDYFAVLPQYRSQGRGSALLREMLERFCRNGGGIFGEVEIPNTGDEAVDSLRRRRLGFYSRAGMRQMGFRTKAFGVPYIIIAYGPEISDEELMEVDRKIYRSVCPTEEYYREHVTIPYTVEGI